MDRFPFSEAKGSMFYFKKTYCSCPRWTHLWSQSWTSGSYFIQGNRWIQSAECLRRVLVITTQVWEEITWFRRMWTLFLLSLVIHHTWLAELGRLNCSQYAQNSYLTGSSCSCSHSLSGRVEEQGDCKLKARHRCHHSRLLVLLRPHFCNSKIWSFFMSSGFWKAVCLMEVSSIYRCVIILLKGTSNFWIFSAKVSLSLINCCPACSASLVLATTSPSTFTQPRTQSPTPVIKR